MWVLNTDSGISIVGRKAKFICSMSFPVRTKHCPFPDASRWLDGFPRKWYYVRDSVLDSAAGRLSNQQELDQIHFTQPMYNLHPFHHGYSVYEAIGQGLGWLGYEPNGYPQNRPSCNLIIKILLCSCSSLMNIHMKSKHLHTLLIQRALPIYLFPKPILLSFSSNYVLSKSLPIQSNHKPAAQKSV